MSRTEREATAKPSHVYGSLISLPFVNNWITKLVLTHTALIQIRSLELPRLYLIIVCIVPLCIKLLAFLVWLFLLLFHLLIILAFRDVVFVDVFVLN